VEARGQLQQEHTALEEARAKLKLRDAKIARLTGELVQEVMLFEELRSASEEEDATILELQQAAETTHTVKGESPLSILYLQLGFVKIRSRLTFFLFSGLRAALGTSSTLAEALQAAYNSSQQELEGLQEAALEACQSVDEGVEQAGSSMASRLRALGDHVARRMRGALRLGIQKTLSVV
jgi:hypothetical protein